MSATLKLERATNGLMELRRSPFDILIDDQRVGSVQRHERTEASIEPGHHTLQVRAGRYSSHPRSFDVGEGEVVTFRCNGAKIWPVYLASLVKPDLALTLKRE